MGGGGGSDGGGEVLRGGGGGGGRVTFRQVKAPPYLLVEKPSV